MVNFVNLYTYNNTRYPFWDNGYYIFENVLRDYSPKLK